MVEPPSAVRPGPLRSVGIVGLGLMGGSLALALRADASIRLIGVDSNPTTVARARQLGIECSDRLDSLRGVQVIVLAVPMHAMREVLGAVSPLAGDAVVTDLASTKAPVMGWAKAAGVDLLAGHPMCGREKAGLDSAEEGLFRGAPWLLDRSQPLVEEMIKKVGAVPLIVPVEEQDHLVAGVSHTAHLVSVAYLLALTESEQWSQMALVAGPGFRDTTRLAASDPSLFTLVLMSNAANVETWLGQVIDRLQDLRQALEEDPAALRHQLETAAAARRAWAEQRENAGPR